MKVKDRVAPHVESPATEWEDILDGILVREGPGTPPYLDPHDRGGRTAYGISERAHPEAWLAGPPTRDAARAIYRTSYLAPFAALEVDPRVREALIDDAVVSGVAAAVTTLQRVLRVEPDGVIGPVTIAAAKGALDGDWLVLRVVEARVLRLARIVERDQTQARFLVGWITRALALLG